MALSAAVPHAAVDDELVSAAGQVNLYDKPIPGGREFFHLGDGLIAGAEYAFGRTDPIRDIRPKNFTEGKAGGMILVYNRNVREERPASAAGTGDLTRFQGTWQGWMIDGNGRADAVLVIEGSTATLSKGKGDERKELGASEFKLDSSGKHKSIDFSPEEADSAQALKGAAIYELSPDGKSLEMCICREGPRPTKLEKTKRTIMVVVNRDDGIPASQGPEPSKKSASKPTRKPAPSKPKPR